MRKLTKVVAALAVLLCGFVLGGCTEEETEEILNSFLGPEQTWCETAVSYASSTDSSNTVSLYVDFFYTDESVTSSTSGSSSLKNGMTIPAGLTVVVWTKTNSNSVISALTPSTYIMKTFSSINATSLDDDTTDSEAFSFKGSRANWTLLYRAKEDLRTNTQMKHPLAPTVLTNGSSATELTDLTGFSWKSLLKKYLYTTLLNQLE